MKLGSALLLRDNYKIKALRTSIFSYPKRYVQDNSVTTAALDIIGYPELHHGVSALLFRSSCFIAQGKTYWKNIISNNSLVYLTSRDVESICYGNI